ncbi:MAG: hydroxyethylthiazole kinase [Deltaproteobacteria bacterium]|nr:hydroxyethylthiazole kinase [Deltaproteobacteria bacterium]
MTDWPRRAAAHLAAVRRLRPMVHHLTNDVVTNLTANVTLCLGAAPVMAPSVEEVEEMVGFAGCLLLNIGTLDPPLVESMIRAGRRANDRDIPVVLDPVGAGATRLRTESALRILDACRVSVLRGNAGEVLTLVGSGGKVRGVDSMEDMAGRDEAVAAWAARNSTVVAVTGPVDLVTDGRRRLYVHNGHPILGAVTGTGCSATTAVASFLAASREDPAASTALALAVFGLAAEQAAARSAGPGTFVPHLLDALYALDEAACMAGIRMEQAA